MRCAPPGCQDAQRSRMVRATREVRSPHRPLSSPPRSDRTKTQFLEHVVSGCLTRTPVDEFDACFVIDRNPFEWLREFVGLTWLTNSPWTRPSLTPLRRLLAQTVSLPFEPDELTKGWPVPLMRSRRDHSMQLLRCSLVKSLRHFLNPLPPYRLAC